MTESPARELADRWVAGWASSRERDAVRDGSGWVVAIASTSRAVEHVVADPDAAEAERLVAATTGRPDVWVTVVGELRPDAAAAFAALEAFEHAESLMVTELAAGEAGPTTGPLDADAPDGVQIEVRGGVAFARIVRGDVKAAVGQVAVLGTDAVIDKIETHPEFRRQGLGRLLMSALTAWAVGRGAQTGLLVASEEGRELYLSLNWRDAAAITTFRGRAVG